MAEPTEFTQQQANAEAEHRFHSYIGHEIPMYVRLLWVGFYCLAIWYVVAYMFPAIQEEFRPKTGTKSLAPAPAEKEASK